MKSIALDVILQCVMYTVGQLSYQLITSIIHIKQTQDGDGNNNNNNGVNCFYFLFYAFNFETKSLPAIVASGPVCTFINVILKPTKYFRRFFKCFKPKKTMRFRSFGKTTKRPWPRGANLLLGNKIE